MKRQGSGGSNRPTGSASRKRSVSRARPVGSVPHLQHFDQSAATHPIEVVIDLDRIRANARAIKRETGRAVIAVVKSDAYGLGAGAVSDALAGIVDEFAYFNLSEARAVGRPGLILGPLSGPGEAHAELSVRPAVGSISEARAVGRIPAALNVDTGMQRFGCRPEEIDAIRRISHVVEAFTHTIKVAGARMLARLCAGKVARVHAAGTALLDRPTAWLDAVRPGLGLYLGAMTVRTRLAVARELDGPAGYRQFRSRRAGVILCGYSSGFAPGVVLVKGRRRRVLEVGMNTAFVEVGSDDAPGDEVTLLGGALTEMMLAKALGCSPHDVLCRYSRLGPRGYVGES
ncbi:MAG: alanine racemase [Phycisphaerae bacterium]|nr:alanine racemase [Phycisphaerae bacterium]